MRIYKESDLEIETDVTETLQNADQQTRIRILKDLGVNDQVVRDHLLAIIPEKVQPP